MGSWRNKIDCAPNDPQDDGVSARLSYAKDTVRWRFPADCLGIETLKVSGRALDISLEALSREFHEGDMINKPDNEYLFRYTRWITFR